jgi:hypothetical protein
MRRVSSDIALHPLRGILQIRMPLAPLPLFIFHLCLHLILGLRKAFYFSIRLLDRCAKAEGTLPHLALPLFRIELGDLNPYTA